MREFMNTPAPMWFTLLAVIVMAIAGEVIRRRGIDRFLTRRFLTIESPDVYAGMITYTRRGEDFKPYLVEVGDRRFIGFLEDLNDKVLRDSEHKIFCPHNQPKKDEFGLGSSMSSRVH